MRSLWERGLLEDLVGELVSQSRTEAKKMKREEEVEKELGYFTRNKERMKYGTFREKGYFIGSGVVEAGCKTVIGARCKKLGMFWSINGAQNVLSLRCIHRSHRLEQFWKCRYNQLVARNDPLPLAA